MTNGESASCGATNMPLKWRSLTITGGKDLSREKQAPLHPGEILQQEFLEPMGLSQNKLAMALRVPARRINEIVLGKRGVTADTALRLARFANGL